MLKTPINPQYSRYGTFNSDASISFRRDSAPHIYMFCGESAELFYMAYPCIMDSNVDIKRKLAIQISKELLDFAPHIGADISIIYDTDEFNLGFKIVLRDPQNIGSSFLTNFCSNKKRSYVDAQLNTVAAFLLDKKANHRCQTASRTAPIMRADKSKV